MDQPAEIINAKNEPTDSTSTINSIKEENDCFVHPESVFIKTEPQEDESEFPVDARTSYEMCHNFDVKIETDETMVEIESENQFDEPVQDPLDVNSEIKSEANKEHLPLEPIDESKFTMENIEKEDCSLIRDEELKSIEKEVAGIKMNRKTKKQVCNKIFTCQICKESFNQKNHLHNHMLKHNVEKPHICDVCERGYTCKSSLNVHKLTHIDETLFSCKECNKSFKYKTNLDNHKQIHTDGKPYTCDLCDKIFTQKSNLIRHKHFHTGKRQFSCNLCNKTFVRKSYLTIHERYHTGEKPFSCDICNKTFVQNPDLTRHKKLHNPISKIDNSSLPTT